MKASQITTAARRIAKIHNNRLKNGFAGNGFLVVNTYGHGGAWYSADARPQLNEHEIKVSMRWRKMSHAEAQEILDNV